MAKGDGGAILINTSTANISGSILSNNRAYENGGALSIVYGYNVIFISNTIIINNTAKLGSVYFLKCFCCI